MFGPVPHLPGPLCEAPGMIATGPGMAQPTERAPPAPSLSPTARRKLLDEPLFDP